jgi:hypothetical protein
MGRRLAGWPDRAPGTRERTRRARRTHARQTAHKSMHTHVHVQGPRVPVLVGPRRQAAHQHGQRARQVRPRRGHAQAVARGRLPARCVPGKGVHPPPHTHTHTHFPPPPHLNHSSVRHPLPPHTNAHARTHARARGTPRPFICRSPPPPPPLKARVCLHPCLPTPLLPGPLRAHHPSATHSVPSLPRSAGEAAFLPTPSTAGGSGAEDEGVLLSAVMSAQGKSFLLAGARRGLHARARPRAAAVRHPVQVGLGAWGKRGEGGGVERGARGRKGGRPVHAAAALPLDRCRCADASCWVLMWASLPWPSFSHEPTGRLCQGGGTLGTLSSVPITRGRRPSIHPLHAAGSTAPSCRPRPRAIERGAMQSAASWGDVLHEPCRAAGGNREMWGQGAECRPRASKRRPGAEGAGSLYASSGQWGGAVQVSGTTCCVSGGRESEGTGKFEREGRGAAGERHNRGITIPSWGSIVAHLNRVQCQLDLGWVWGWGGCTDERSERVSECRGLIERGFIERGLIERVRRG